MVREGVSPSRRRSPGVALPESFALSHAFWFVLGKKNVLLNAGQKHQHHIIQTLLGGGVRDIDWTSTSNIGWSADPAAPPPLRAPALASSDARV